MVKTPPEGRLPYCISLICAESFSICVLLKGVVSIVRRSTLACQHVYRQFLLTCTQVFRQNVMQQQQQQQQQGVGGSMSCNAAENSNGHQPSWHDLCPQLQWSTRTMLLKGERKLQLYNV